MGSKVKKSRKYADESARFNTDTNGVADGRKQYRRRNFLATKDQNSPQNHLRDNQLFLISQGLGRFVEEIAGYSQVLMQKALLPMALG